MRKKGQTGLIVLVVTVIAALAVFLLLYQKERIKVEKVETKSQKSSLSEWSVEKSTINGVSLQEDKSIYGESDTAIYDVYLSVFPTKDSDGKMLDFSAFGKHVSRDHTYNPVLNCNIQILQEDEKLDPLLSLDEKKCNHQGQR